MRTPVVGNVDISIPKSRNAFCLRASVRQLSCELLLVCMAAQLWLEAHLVPLEFIRLRLKNLNLPLVITLMGPLV